MDVKRFKQQCSSRGLSISIKCLRLNKMIEMLLKNDVDPKIMDDLETKIKCHSYQKK